MRHRSLFPGALAGFAATFLSAFLAVTGGGAVETPLSSASAGASAMDSPPNVVVVMTDDQDAASARFMPHVRRQLAGHGTTFPNSFVTTPLCCPSRATFLTGQYSHNHGVLSNDPPNGGYPALDDSNTLPLWLQRAGYRTAHVGRYLNHYAEPALGGDPTEIPPGWDEWQVPVGDEFRMYGYTLNENGQLTQYAHRGADYQTDVFARKAVRFVERSAPRPAPFFLSVAPVAPHDESVLEGTNAARNPRPAPRHRGSFSGRPLPRPPSFNERAIGDKPATVRNNPPLDHAAIQDLKARYWSRLESLRAVDELVRDLVASLRRRHELQNTLFVFTSDNGFLLGEHRTHGKQSLYEESIRVPLVVRGPGFPRDTTRSQPVANVDLAPTIVDLARVRPPYELDGRSLLPLAEDRSAGTERGILIELRGESVFSAVHTDRYVYGEHGSGAVELYDLKEDTYQLRNLADDRAYDPVRTRLATALESLRHCSGSECMTRATG